METGGGGGGGGSNERIRPAAAAGAAPVKNPSALHQGVNMDTGGGKEERAATDEVGAGAVPSACSGQKSRSTSSADSDSRAQQSDVGLLLLANPDRLRPDVQPISSVTETSLHASSSASRSQRANPAANAANVAVAAAAAGDGNKRISSPRTNPAPESTATPKNGAERPFSYTPSPQKKHRNSLEASQATTASCADDDNDQDDLAPLARRKSAVDDLEEIENSGALKPFDPDDDGIFVPTGGLLPSERAGHSERGGNYVGAHGDRGGAREAEDNDFSQRYTAGFLHGGERNGGGANDLRLHGGPRHTPGGRGREGDPTVRSGMPASDDFNSLYLQHAAERSLDETNCALGARNSRTQPRRGGICSSERSESGLDCSVRKRNCERTSTREYAPTSSGDGIAVKDTTDASLRASRVAPSLNSTNASGGALDLSKGQPAGRKNAPSSRLSSASGQKACETSKTAKAAGDGDESDASQTCVSQSTASEGADCGRRDRRDRQDARSDRDRAIKNSRTVRPRQRQTFSEYEEEIRKRVKEQEDIEKREMLALFYEKSVYEGVKVPKKFFRDQLKSDLQEMRWWYYRIIRDSRIEDKVDSMKTSWVEGVRMALFFNGLIKNPLNLKLDDDFPDELATTLNRNLDRHFRQHVKSRCGVEGPPPTPMWHIFRGIVKCGLTYHRNKVQKEQNEKKAREKEEKQRKEEREAAERRAAAEAAYLANLRAAAQSGMGNGAIPMGWKQTAVGTGSPAHVPFSPELGFAYYNSSNYAPRPSTPPPPPPHSSMQTTPMASFAPHDYYQQQQHAWQPTPPGTPRSASFASPSAKNPFPYTNPHSNAPPGSYLTFPQYVPAPPPPVPHVSVPSVSSHPHLSASHRTAVGVPPGSFSAVAAAAVGSTNFAENRPFPGVNVSPGPVREPASAPNRGSARMSPAVEPPSPEKRQAGAIAPSASRARPPATFLQARETLSAVHRNMAPEMRRATLPAHLNPPQWRAALARRTNSSGAKAATSVPDARQALAQAANRLRREIVQSNSGLESGGHTSPNSAEGSASAASLGLRTPSGASGAQKSHENSELESLLLTPTTAKGSSSTGAATLTNFQRIVSSNANQHGSRPDGKVRNADVLGGRVNNVAQHRAQAQPSPPPPPTGPRVSPASKSSNGAVLSSFPPRLSSRTQIHLGPRPSPAPSAAARRLPVTPVAATNATSRRPRAQNSGSGGGQYADGNANRALETFGAAESEPFAGANTENGGVSEKKTTRNLGNVRGPSQDSSTAAFSAQNPIPAVAGTNRTLLTGAGGSSSGGSGGGGGGGNGGGGVCAGPLLPEDRIVGESKKERLDEWNASPVAEQNGTVRVSAGTLPPASGNSVDDLLNNLKLAAASDDDASLDAEESAVPSSFNGKAMPALNNDDKMSGMLMKLDQFMGSGGKRDSAATRNERPVLYDIDDILDDMGNDGVSGGEEGSDCRLGSDENFKSENRRAPRDVDLNGLNLTDLRVRQSSSSASIRGRGGRRRQVVRKDNAPDGERAKQREARRPVQRPAGTKEAGSEKNNRTILLLDEVGARGKRDSIVSGDAERCSDEADERLKRVSVDALERMTNNNPSGEQPDRPCTPTFAGVGAGTDGPFIAAHKRNKAGTVSYGWITPPPSQVLTYGL